MRVVALAEREEMEQSRAVVTFVQYPDGETIDVVLVPEHVERSAVNPGERRVVCRETGAWLCSDGREVKMKQLWIPLDEAKLREWRGNIRNGL